MSKNSIIKGTLILTFAGFLTRILGFFYRIYLSNALGAEKMGVYQLIFPIYGICFTLYASGIQTSISRLVAAEIGLHNGSTSKHIGKILKVGLSCSLTIACFLSFFVYTNANFIATRFIVEPSSANSLKVLAFVFPFCGATACINGYYYGCKKTTVPATTQLLEQMVRVIFVYIIAVILGRSNQKITCELAVLGLVIGEVASNLYNMVSLYFERKRYHKKTKSPGPNKSIFKELLTLAIPLTSNRLLISILNSLEAVLIPIMLREYGLSTSASLSTFGILTGMAMPFIMFPSAITNSLAVLLLPTISEAQAKKNEALIGKTTAIAIKYSLIIGILSTGVFIIFGNALGITVYHNQTAGTFIMILAWLCPFMYLTTTAGSILNGLGKPHITFFNTVIGLSIRIFFVLFVVPQRGINGYLIGVLISQLAISALDINALYRNIAIQTDLFTWVVKPVLILLPLGFLFQNFYYFAKGTTQLNQILFLLATALAFSCFFLIAMFLTKTISKREFMND